MWAQQVRSVESLKSGNKTYTFKIAKGENKAKKLFWSSFKVDPTIKWLKQMLGKESDKKYKWYQKFDDLQVGWHWIFDYIFEFVMIDKGKKNNASTPVHVPEWYLTINPTKGGEDKKGFEKDDSGLAWIFDQVKDDIYLIDEITGFTKNEQTIKLKTIKWIEDAKIKITMDDSTKNISKIEAKANSVKEWMLISIVADVKLEDKNILAIIEMYKKIISESTDQLEKLWDEFDIVNTFVTKYNKSNTPKINKLAPFVENNPQELKIDKKTFYINLTPGLGYYTVNTVEGADQKNIKPIKSNRIIDIIDRKNTYLVAWYKALIDVLKDETWTDENNKERGDVESTKNNWKIGEDSQTSDARLKNEVNAKLVKITLEKYADEIIAKLENTHFSFSKIQPDGVNKNIWKKWMSEFDEDDQSLWLVLDDLSINEDDQSISFAFDNSGFNKEYNEDQKIYLVNIVNSNWDINLNKFTEELKACVKNIIDNMQNKQDIKNEKEVLEDLDVEDIENQLKQDFYFSDVKPDSISNELWEWWKSEFSDDDVQHWKFKLDAVDISISEDRITFDLDDSGPDEDFNDELEIAITDVIDDGHFDIKKFNIQLKICVNKSLEQFLQLDRVSSDKQLLAKVDADEIIELLENAKFKMTDIKPENISESDDIWIKWQGLFDRWAIIQWVGLNDIDVDVEYNKIIFDFDDEGINESTNEEIVVNLAEVLKQVWTVKVDGTINKSKFLENFTYKLKWSVHTVLWKLIASEDWSDAAKQFMWNALDVTVNEDTLINWSETTISFHFDPENEKDIKQFKLKNETWYEIEEIKDNWEAVVYFEVDDPNGFDDEAEFTVVRKWVNNFKIEMKESAEDFKKRYSIYLEDNTIIVSSKNAMYQTPNQSKQTTTETKPTWVDIKDDSLSKMSWSETTITFEYWTDEKKEVRFINYSWYQIKSLEPKSYWYIYIEVQSAWSNEFTQFRLIKPSGLLELDIKDESFNDDYIMKYDDISNTIAIYNNKQSDKWQELVDIFNKKGIFWEIKYESNIYIYKWQTIDEDEIQTEIMFNVWLNDIDETLAKDAWVEFNENINRWIPKRFEYKDKHISRNDDLGKDLASLNTWKDWIDQTLNS